MELCAKLLGDGAGERRLLVPRVLCRDGFDQRDPSLFDGGGVMANAAGHDEKFARLELDIATVSCATTDTELTAKNEKEFVFMRMRVPGELSVDTRYLHILIVDLTDHSRRPKLRKSAAREFEGEGMLLHRKG
jgi:hypothetical protein